MRKNYYKTFLSSLLLSSVAFSQDGTLDQSFGNNGIVKNVATENLAGLKILSDGNFVVASSIQNTTKDFAVVRYLSNGTIDNTFGNNGIVSVDFNNSTDKANAIYVQNDNKIIVVGQTQATNNNNSDIAIVRLNSNGTIDNSFGTNGKFVLDVDGYLYDSALDVAIQKNGKILVVAMAGTDMFAKTAILRLNANGTLDNTFDSDGIIKAFSFGSFTLSSLQSLIIQPDDKILVTGSKNNNLTIARLNQDGTLDSNFGTSGTYSSTDMATFSKIYLQNDGKILGTLSHTSQNEVKLFRLNENGTLDNNFGTNGKVSTPIGTSGTYDYARDIIQLANGKIIVVGSTFSSSYNSDYLVIRYESNGTIDNSFGTNGNGQFIQSVNDKDEDLGQNVQIQKDGKIVLGGSSCSGSCDVVLLRINNTGGTSNVLEIENKINFNISPNPSKGVFTIQTETPAQFELVDISGKVFATYNVQSKLEVNNENLQSGVYFLRAKEYGVTMKIVIE